MVRQEHPAGKEVIALAIRSCRQLVRKIAESGVDIHLAVTVEARWVQTDAPLEIPVDPDPGCARVPPVSVDVLEGVPMSGALDESARLVRNRIVRGVSEWAERIVSDVDTRRVNVVLSARRAVL